MTRPIYHADGHLMGMWCCGEYYNFEKGERIPDTKGIQDALQTQCGFKPLGLLAVPGGAVRIPGNRFVATRSSSRIKMGRGSLRVTIGSRTTSFYAVANRKACGFVNWKTKELCAQLHEGILVAVLRELREAAQAANPATLELRRDKKGGG